MERQFKIRGTILEGVQDLGVYVHKSLKMAGQVLEVFNRAYCTLDFLNKGIEYKIKEVTSNLNTYCTQFWAPCFRKNVKAFERMQVRFTGTVRGMRNSSYIT